MTGLAVQVQNRRFDSPVALLLASGSEPHFLSRTMQSTLGITACPDMLRQLPAVASEEHSSGCPLEGGYIGGGKELGTFRLGANKLLFGLGKWWAGAGYKLVARVPHWHWGSAKAFKLHRPWGSPLLISHARTWSMP
jgi:hypothetical protein